MRAKGRKIDRRVQDAATIPRPDRFLLRHNSCLNLVQVAARTNCFRKCRTVGQVCEGTDAASTKKDAGPTPHGRPDATATELVRIRQTRTGTLNSFSVGVVLGEGWAELIQFGIIFRQPSRMRGGRTRQIVDNRFSDRVCTVIFGTKTNTLFPIRKRGSETGPCLRHKCAFKSGKVQLQRLCFQSCRKQTCGRAWSCALVSLRQGECECRRPRGCV